MKTKTTMDARLLDIIDPIAQDLGYKVVRLRVMSGKRATVQIMAERLLDAQMGVDDCAILSRAVSSELEVEDPIDGAYVLEVSSPGMDRPLTDLQDFTTYAGYLARIELDRLVEGKKRFRGVLAGLDEGQVALDIDGESETALIPFDWIAEAKLLITDEMIKAGQKRAELKRKNNQETDADA